MKVKRECTSECTQASEHLAGRSWDPPGTMQWELKRNKCNKMVSLAIQFAAVKFFLQSPNLQMVEKNILILTKKTDYQIPTKFGSF